MRSETRVRSQVVQVRVSDEEHERYAALAAKHGWSLPQLMRLAVETVLLQESIQPPRREAVL